MGVQDLCFRFHVRRVVETDNIGQASVDSASCATLLSFEIQSHIINPFEVRGIAAGGTGT